MELDWKAAPFCAVYPFTFYVGQRSEPLWSLSFQLEYLTMVMWGCGEISGGMQHGCWRSFMVYITRGLMKARTHLLNGECVCVCVCVGVCVCVCVCVWVCVRERRRQKENRIGKSMSEKSSRMGENKQKLLGKFLFLFFIRVSMFVLEWFWIPGFR